jgi:hypothetical protein
MKVNKFLTAMVGEAIVSFCFGMDSLTRTINMIVFLLGYGEKMLKKRQGRLFSQDI